MLGRRWKRGMRMGQKKKNTILQKLWSVRRPICLFEFEAESLFKMHQMLECEVGPDSICDALWRHPHRSFPDVVCIHTRKVWSKGLARVGPCGVEVDRSFQQGPVKSQQPGPIKSEWEELEAFNSNLKPCCQASHYPWYQKITGKGQAWAGFPMTS